MTISLAGDHGARFWAGPEGVQDAAISSSRVGFRDESPGELAALLDAVADMVDETCDSVMADSEVASSAQHLQRLLGMRRAEVEQR